MAIQGSSGNNFDNPAARTQQASTQRQPQTSTDQQQTGDTTLSPADQASQHMAYSSGPRSGNLLASQVLAQSGGPVNITQTENEFGGVSVTFGVDADGNGVNEAEATEVYDAQGNLLAVTSSQDADQDGNAEFADGFSFDAAGNISSYTAMVDENDDGNVDYMYQEQDTSGDGVLDTFTESLFDQNGELVWRSSKGAGATSSVDASSASGTTTSTPDANPATTTGSFVSEHAGYSNAVYTYDLDDNGEPTNIRPVIDNTNTMTPGSELNDISVSNGRPNLLVLANGANVVDENSQLELVDGKLTIDGQAHEGPSYFSHDPDLSTDGENHFRFSTGSDGATRVEIEDLAGLGDRDFNDIVLAVNTPNAGTPGQPVEPPAEPPVPPVEPEPPVQPPQQRDDGTDVYVIDSLGDHGGDVSSVVSATAGEGIDVALSGLPGIQDFDLPETRSESATVVNQNIDVLKGSLESAIVAQLGEAGLNDPSIQSMFVGLDEAMANFENGTETMSDYLMVEESLTLLQFIDPAAAQNVQFQLTSATNYHLNNFSDSADVQDFLSGNLVLTPETRRAIGSEHTGYDVVESYLESFAQQYHAQDISALGDTYGQIAAYTVGGVTADLKNGLALSGLVDEQGNPVAVPGFGADEQPVRVANVSAGVSLSDIVAGSAESRLLNLFPPPEDSVLGQSIAAMSPDGQPLSIEAAIANSAWEQMNDPTTNAGQIYAENVALQNAYVQSLLDANIIIVAAAGNSGGRIPDADPGASRNLLVSDSMISVGASNAQGTGDDLTDDTLAGFSSAGADFVAEGENFVHNGEVLNGTSFSAPQVSGLIARVAEKYPDLSADQILAILFDPANRDVLFEDIEGTEQDGLGIIRDDAIDVVFANQA